MINIHHFVSLLFSDLLYQLIFSIRSKIYFTCKSWSFKLRCISYRDSTPFTLVAGETFRGQAGLLANSALRTARQVPFTPVMFMLHKRKLFARQVRCVLFAVSHCEILTLQVNKVVADYNRDKFLLISHQKDKTN